MSRNELQEKAKEIELQKARCLNRIADLKKSLPQLASGRLANFEHLIQMIEAMINSGSIIDFGKIEELITKVEVAKQNDIENICSQLYAENPFVEAEKKEEKKKADPVIVDFTHPIIFLELLDKNISFRIDTEKKLKKEKIILPVDNSLKEKYANEFKEYQRVNKKNQTHPEKAEKDFFNKLMVAIDKYLPGKGAADFIKITAGMLHDPMIKIIKQPKFAENDNVIIFADKDSANRFKAALKARAHNYDPKTFDPNDPSKSHKQHVMPFGGKDVDRFEFDFKIGKGAVTFLDEHHMTRILEKLAAKISSNTKYHPETHSFTCPDGNPRKRLKMCLEKLEQNCKKLQAEGKIFRTDDLIEDSMVGVVHAAVARFESMVQRRLEEKSQEKSGEKGRY